MSSHRPLVLLAGMPRAGTSWGFQLLNTLWVEAGHQDSHEIRTRYKLERYMSRGNSLIPTTLPQMLFVLWPWLLGNSYVVKTHTSTDANPRRIISRWFYRALIAHKVFMPIYMYRDPRDAILSGYEYGQRSIRGGSPNAFARNIPSIEVGIDWVTPHVKVNWKSWSTYPGVLVIRYEDFMLNFDDHINRILKYLNIELPEEKLHDIMAEYQPGASITGAHFHKGQAGRFREVFTREQQQRCIDQFGSYLLEMGYEL